VFRGEQTLSEVARCHKRPDRRLHCHIECQQLRQGNIQDSFAFLNLSCCVDTSVVFCVVTKFKLWELGTSLSHPIEHSVKSFSLRMIQRDTFVVTDLFLLHADVLFYRLNQLLVFIWLLVCCFQRLVQNSKSLFI
jgi:hypothetical protein